MTPLILNIGDKDSKAHITIHSQNEIKYIPNE